MKNLVLAAAAALFVGMFALTPAPVQAASFGATTAAASVAKDQAAAAVDQVAAKKPAKKKATKKIKKP
jgi:uncharacterized protein involved in copper resistance